MSRIARVAAAIALLGLVGSTADAAIKVTPVVPPLSDICGACEAPQVRLPITVEGLSADKKVSVAVRDVSLNNRHDSEYRTGLAASVVEVESHLELHVTVAPTALRDDGTYLVALEFSAPGELPAAMTVQLVRTAAALQPPGTIIVERVLTTPWSESGGIGPPLRLLEMSQRTGLADVQVVSPNPLAAERIDVTLPPVNCSTASTANDLNAGSLLVPPGQARCLEYAARGDFPWGSQVQSYSLMASELAAPVPITFDVRTRLWRIYVVVYILLGGLIGFVVKIKLQQGIDRREAVDLALALEEKVATDLAKHQDSRFRSALQDPLAALQQARSGARVEDIVAARTALDAAWRAVLADLATRRTTAEQLVDRLRTVAETQWQLPQTLLQAIDALRLRVGRIRELLAADAVSQATDLATAAVKETRDSLAVALAAWQAGVVDLFDAVVNSPVGLSPAVVAVATAAASEARMRIGSAQLSPTASADELITVLSAASNEVRAARKVARVIGLALDQETDRVAATLGRSREELPKVVAAVLQVRDALFAGIDRPDLGPSVVRQSLATISKSWKETFEGFAGGALPKALTDLLDQQRFGETATALVESLRGESDQAVRVVRRDVAPAVAADDPAVPIQNFSTRTGPADILAPIQALRARTQREIAAAKLLQTVVVMLLACVVGYGLFAPKFVGDYQDFIIIFFWAFTLDLSVDAVTRLAPTARR